AVCGPASLVNSMMDLHQGALMLLGPTMNAKVAFELSERLPHLGIRMKEHCNRAMTYATKMKKLGLKVIYPGLEDHPQHQLLKSIGNKEYGFGGLLCLDMETEEKANRLMNYLQNFTQFGFMAVSLGYYENLMSCSGSSTSSELNAEEKALAGISPGLVRMSFLNRLHNLHRLYHKSHIPLITQINPKSQIIPRFQITQSPTTTAPPVTGDRREEEEIDERERDRKESGFFMRRSKREIEEEITG
ncbi:hypothetical protein Dsin_008025, partial [Dipteronia sinensis]